MKICRTQEDLNQSIKLFRSQGKKIALVPTMGALHDGHLSLIKLAKKSADVVICSIFLNPKQFAEGEDLATYPRKEAEDCQLLENAEVEIAYLPSVQEMYPEGEEIEEPPLVNDTILEGEFRPHFFKGVGIVVSKLLFHCQPDMAIFGEKDYQQLSVIKNMVRRMGLPIKIIGAPTQRDEDGLALSSRNAYLTESQRKAAPVLFATLNEIMQRYKAGESLYALIPWGEKQILDAGFEKIDYLEVRDAESLDIEEINNPRILVAAKIGKTRLIDNI